MDDEANCASSENLPNDTRYGELTAKPNGRSREDLAAFRIDRKIVIKTIDFEASLTRKADIGGRPLLPKPASRFLGPSLLAGPVLPRRWWPGTIAAAANSPAMLGRLAVGRGRFRWRPRSVAVAIAQRLSAFAKLPHDTTRLPCTMSPWQTRPGP